LQVHRTSLTFAGQNIPMSNETTSKNYDQMLTDWSKWLISINFISGVGCVIALKTAKPVPLIGGFFFAAIVCFALSMITSTLFTLLLAKDSEKEKLPSFVWMAIVQWVLFALGLVFVLLWIARLAAVI
jgi:hypothetical protein